MTNTPLVLDFTGFLVQFASDTGAKTLDCSKIGGAKLYCDPSAEEEIRSLVRPFAALGKTGIPECPARWIDTGDYHYVSEILAGETARPFDLLLLDNHSDTQRPSFGDILSCGGWVRTMLERNPMLGKVVIVGMDPSLAESVSGFGPRIRVVTSDDIGKKEGDELEKTLSGIIESITSSNDIYISIDKDVLDRKYYKTNWSQGTMSLPQLEAILETVGRGVRIVGVDVCGGPPADLVGEEMVNNLKTDLKLWNIIGNILNKQYICKIE